MLEPQATILVVDDEVKNVKLMEALLIPRGYTMLAAYKGEEALHKVQQHPVDLILLDIMMPGMDGFTVCKALKDNPETALIPIVIMTALGRMEDRIKGIEAGADDFLAKPVNRDELLARIRTSVRLKQTIDRKIQSLIDVNQRLAGVIESDDVLKVIVESANQLFSAEGGSVALLDEAEGNLAFTTVVGGARVEQFRLDRGQGIVGWVAQTGRGVVCNDVSQDPRFFRGVDEKTGFHTASIICAPLQQHGKIIGALEVVNTSNPDGFTQENLQMLTALAGLAATALERAKTFSSLRNMTVAFEEVVQDRYRLVVGNSTAMQEALRLARTVAATTSTVLLLGESGTGKEVMARAIHQWSPRAQQPFVAVNCTALTTELLESELFGHEKGAFTGAIAQKKGRFELAEGGALFLDEIGDLAPNLQVKLLRVLQEKEFQRVGGVKDVRADVRIIAATNRDLRLAVQQGSFREDLYYRLNVVSLTLPPLRERPDDIAVLANYFLERYSQELKRVRMTLTPPALALLQVYTWPGNVRELQNVIERTVVLASGREITPDDFPTEVRYSAPSPEKPSDHAITVSEVLPMAEAMDLYQRALIRKALATANNNQSEAAKLLAIPQPSLSRLMKRLGLR